MGIINFLKTHMSYYYGYYDYYGGEEETAPVADDTAAGEDYGEDYGDYEGDYYYEDFAPMELDEDDDMGGDSMMMYKAAWGLAAIGDIAAWSVNDDKWGSMIPLNPDWDNVMNSTLLLGTFRLVAIVGGMAVPAIMMPMAGLTAVWEIANLYLVNKAEGAAANTTSSATNVAYATSAF